MAYLIGQFLGLLVPIFTITVPFWKKKWQILACAIVVNALMVANMLLIGQVGSAALLCAVAVVQSIVSMVHYFRDTPVKGWENVLFFVLYVGLGFVGMFTAPGFVFGINRQNLIKLMPIIGAVLMMLSVFARSEQTTRKFLQSNALVWMVYTAIVGSTVFFAQVGAVIADCVALYKYRGTEK